MARRFCDGSCQSGTHKTVQKQNQLTLTIEATSPQHSTPNPEITARLLGCERKSIPGLDIIGNRVKSSQTNTQFMSSTEEEIEVFWRNAEIAVGTGDFDSYAAMYHPDAVVVEANSTQLVQAALVTWKHGFEETAAGRQKTRLLFRFSLRLDNRESAFARGIFRYEQRKVQEKETSIRYVVFESLMVRKEGRWLWSMEHQKRPATREEWDALPVPTLEQI